MSLQVRWSLKYFFTKLIIYIIKSSPDDCFGQFTNRIFVCSGKQSCNIAFIRNNTQVPKCNDKATYLYINYQCVPVNNAGDPSSSVNTEFCAGDVPESYQVNSSLLIQSPGFGKHPNKIYNCVKNITAKDGFVLDVFLTAYQFPGISKY